ncbi:hypothetical protein HRbin03_00290 [archaeon HR03]|nr:hypothetical protein HRbin03_00290 [archaeon HR03]
MSLVDSKLVENKLVGRREVIAKISFTKPITRDEAKQLIAAHLSIDPARVVVRKLVYHTGSRLVDVYANVYDKVEGIKVFEPLYILIRNKLAERPKK